MRDDDCYDLFVFIVSEMLSTASPTVKLSENQLLKGTGLTQKKLRVRLNHLRMKYVVLNWASARLRMAGGRFRTENTYYLTEINGWG